MKLTTLLNHIVFGLAVAAILAWIVGPESGLEVDQRTFFYFSVFLIVLFMLLWVADKRNDPLLLLLILSAIPAFGFSTVMMLWDRHAFTLGNLGTPSPYEIGRAIVFATLATIASATGLVIGRPSKLVPVRSDVRPPADQFFAYRRFLICWSLLTAIIGAILSAMANIGASGVSGGSFGWMAPIFDRDVALLVCIVLGVAYSSQLSHCDRKLLLFFFAFYVGLATFQGSRGGLGGIAFMWLVFSVCRLGNFYLSRRFLAYGVVVIGITVLFLYNFGTALRYIRLYNQPFSSENIYYYFNAVQQLSTNSLISVLQRYSRMDQLIVIVNEWVPSTAARIPPEDLLLNAGSGLLPGSISSESYMSLGQVFPVIYRGFPVDIIHGEEWSAPAVAFLYLGEGGALLALFAWGLLCARVYEWLRRFSGGYGSFIQASFTYWMVFGMFQTGLVDVLPIQFIRSILSIGGLLLVSHVVAQSSRARHYMIS